MKVICRKIISPITKEDLGNESPWLKLGKEYVVLALELSSKGIRIVIKTEHFAEPAVIDIDGFEFVDQKIPSSWITNVMSEENGKKIIIMLPASWNYESFFEDLEDGKPEAVALYTKEAQQIYKEEEHDKN